MPYIFIFIFYMYIRYTFANMCIYIYGIFIEYICMSKNIGIDTVDSKIYMRQTIQKGIMDRYINIYIQNKNVYI